MNLLIITCSVAPKLQPDLKIADPEIRLFDYVKAITMWSENTNKTNTQIWVLENTDSLATLEYECSKKNLDNSRIKFIEIPLDTKSQKFGKSAGEFEMLKFVAQKIADGDFENITKVTGRLFVKNFQKCLKFPSEVDFACGRFYYPSHILDSRFFSVSPEVYEMIFSGHVEFSSQAEKTSLNIIKNFRSMEHYLTYRAFQLEDMGLRVTSFPVAPLYIGHSASTGKKLNSTNVKFKICVANLFRKIGIKLISGYTP